ncbi:MAG: hypothetical protein KJP20_04920 [Bacteroidia bacterium]|nr:hypothetical protein [Bacteroidia bacterium]NNL32406.1 hypothetical protein [Flavobacteriaceae bacterium]
MKRNTLYLITALFSVLTINGQQKLEKTTKSLNVNKDVTIDLNTSYTNIQIDTWDKNKVEVVAFIESDVLSKKELEEALKNWDVKIEGGGANMSIKTGGNYNFNWNFDFADEEAIDALKAIKFEMADLPEMPEMPEMPPMPAMPDMPDMPEMPELPELPELPEGVHSVNFDSKAYEKEGEAYLERWSKEYELKYGKEYKDKMKAWAKEFSKIDFDSYSAKMEAWGKKFGEKFGKDYERDMEKWGEEFSKRFDDKWAKEMEAWGDKFGEQFGEAFEKRMEERAADLEKRMKEREARIEERTEDRNERLEERSKELEARMKEREAKRDEIRMQLENTRKGKVKRTLIIKMPKDAKLKLDVRHGELKFSSVIRDLKANLSYTKLAAHSIDGSNTSIIASYSPISINSWNDGALEIRYVEDARIQDVRSMSLTSNSSNVSIERLNGNAIINGSFGDLTIRNISERFNNLNIILENSDALINLPKSNFNLVFKGNRSRFNNESTTSKNIKNYPSGSTTNYPTILVNAKFSNIIAQ